METIVTAQEASQRLGLSPSQLRRHVAAYERVHGELGRDGKRHRIYTLTAVQRIEAAYQALTAGRSPVSKPRPTRSSGW